MPVRPTKNKKPFSSHVDESLLEKFKEYVDARGETIATALERALRREMAYPPADEPEPLPDSPKAKK